jgi:hypothetical protein
MEVGMRFDYDKESVTLSFARVSWDEWYVFYRDGRVTYHGENKTWQFIKEGPESIDKTFTRAECFTKLQHSFIQAIKPLQEALVELDHPFYHVHFMGTLSGETGYWYPCTRTH